MQATGEVVVDDVGRYEELDAQIEHIQKQIAASSSRHAALRSYLLTTRPLQSSVRNPESKVLKSRIEKTTRDNQTAAHRLTMGATLFTTRDPDPYAVDEGAVTGIRFESYDSATRTFTTPSYVFLNKPWRVVQPDRNDEDDRDTRFRIHRHTLPPSVHLEALAEKYLPAPADSSSAKQTKKQDLQGFVRALRKELVSLRKRQQITKKSSENTWRLEAVNAEATDMRVTWSSGEVGRLRIDKDGSIEECFVDAEEGTRRRYLERKIKHIDSVQHLTAALEDRTT